MLEAHARQHMRKLLNEALETRMVNNLCEYWLSMNGPAFKFLMLAVKNIIQMEKLLRYFAFSSINFGLLHVGFFIT